MRVDVSAYHNAFRLLGTRAAMDTGPGAATIEIYAEEVSGGSPTGSPPLVVIVLAKPSATIGSDGKLLLIQADLAGDLIMVTGAAAGARFKGANDEWIMDTDVGLEASDAAVRLPTLALYAGGRCPLAPSKIG